MFAKAAIQIVAIFAANQLLCACAVTGAAKAQPVGEIEESFVNVVQTLGQSAKKLASSVNATSAEGAALAQVLAELHELKAMARHLKGRRAVEIQSSRSEIESLKGALALAEGRSEALMIEKKHLKALVDQGVASVQNCTLELALHSENATRRKLAENATRGVVVRESATSNCSQVNATAEQHAVAESATQLRASERLVAQVRAQVATCSQEKDQLAKERDQLTKAAGEAHYGEGLANANDISLQKELTALKARISEAEEDKDDATETVDELQAANANLQRTADARGALVNSLQHDVNVSNSDKTQLLDSMRALMARDNKLQAMVARGESRAAVVGRTNVAASSSTNAATVSSTAGVAASNLSSPPKTFDDVLWMARTNKIDKYLSHIGHIDDASHVTGANAQRTAGGSKPRMVERLRGKRRAQ